MFGVTNPHPVSFQADLARGELNDEMEAFSPSLCLSSLPLSQKLTGPLRRTSPLHPALLYMFLNLSAVSVCVVQCMPPLECLLHGPDLLSPSLPPGPSAPATFLPSCPDAA